LFGDGAAATVIAGSEIGGRQGGGARRVIATRSVFYPTERTMGWNVVDSGLKIVLSPAIPKLVREHIGSGTRCLGSEGRVRSLYRRSYARCRVSEHSSTDTIRAIRSG
jgi:predicted naringenin-chalcone synthase